MVSKCPVVFWFSVSFALPCAAHHVELQSPPDNDNCAGALPIAIGGSALDNNTLAEDDSTPTCFDIPTPGKGLWYSVVGTGNTMTASTCSDSTALDTAIQVFCDCDSLECVAANDDDYLCEC